MDDYDVEMLDKPKLTIDPRRDIVQAERHARPPVPTHAPAICQHIVFHNPKMDMAHERRSCLNICEQLGLVPYGELTDQIRAEEGGLSLKWERHTEFSSYTLIQTDVKNRNNFVPWTDRDLNWESVPGKVLVSLLVGMETRKNPSWSKLDRFQWQNGKPLCSSLVLGDTTILESDLDTDNLGYTRYLIKTSATEPSRLGRLLQRVIEIETYGTLCLYAWKDVKEIGPLLADTELKLGGLTSRLARKHEADDVILGELAELSASHEEVTSRSHFRLNASLAYHDIADRRLNELREVRITGYQRFSSFIPRRMNPAARTYRSILKRQAETAERINRATQLLRGRIEVAIGKQNQELLKSMNVRAEAQYKLQKTVEGLSVVAISYYALGIIAYLAALVAGKYVDLSVKEMVGVAVPVVLILVWLSVRKIRS